MSDTPDPLTPTARAALATLPTTVSLADLAYAEACYAGQAACASAYIGEHVPEALVDYLDKEAITFDLELPDTWDTLSFHDGATADFFAKNDRIAISAVYFCALYAHTGDRLWSDLCSAMSDREVPSEPGSGHRAHWFAGLHDRIESGDDGNDVVEAYGRWVDQHGTPRPWDPADIPVGAWIHTTDDSSGAPGWYRVRRTLDDDGDVWIDAPTGSHRGWVHKRTITAVAVGAEAPEAPEVPTVAPAGGARTLQGGWTLATPARIYGSDARYRMFGQPGRTGAAMVADTALADLRSPTTLLPDGLIWSDLPAPASPMNTDRGTPTDAPIPVDARLARWIETVCGSVRWRPTGGPLDPVLATDAGGGIVGAIAPLSRVDPGAIHTDDGIPVRWIFRDGAA